MASSSTHDEIFFIILVLSVYVAKTIASICVRVQCNVQITLFAAAISKFSSYSLSNPSSMINPEPWKEECVIAASFSFEHFTVSYSLQVHQL